MGGYHYVSLNVKKPSHYTNVSRAARIAGEKVHEIMQQYDMTGI